MPTPALVIAIALVTVMSLFACNTTLASGCVDRRRRNGLIGAGRVGELIHLRQSGSPRRLQQLY